MTENEEQEGAAEVAPGLTEQELLDLQATAPSEIHAWVRALREVGVEEGENVVTFDVDRSPLPRRVPFEALLAQSDTVVTVNLLVEDRVVVPEADLMASVAEGTVRELLERYAHNTLDPNAGVYGWAAYSALGAVVARDGLIVPERLETIQKIRDLTQAGDPDDQG